MYRIIKSNRDSKHVIDIVFNFYDVDDTSTIQRVSAASKVKSGVPHVDHPLSAGHATIAENQLEIYNNFLRKMYKLIVATPHIDYKGFESHGNDYSCYINFVSNATSEYPETWTARIRTSGHASDTMPRADLSPTSTGRRLLRSIAIGPNQEFKNTSFALECFQDMLKQISVRNLEMDTIEYPNPPGIEPDVFFEED